MEVDGTVTHDDEITAGARLMDDMVMVDEGMKEEEDDVSTCLFYYKVLMAYIFCH